MKCCNLLLFSFILLLSGCSQLAVGPNYTEPSIVIPDTHLPDAGLTAAGESLGRLTITTNELKTWWMVFHDDTLTNLIITAFTHNLNYQIARERLQQSRADVQISIAGLLPSLGVEADYGHTVASKNSMSGAMISEYNQYTAGFDAAWEVDIFGGKRRSVEAAQATWEQSEYAHQFIRVSLAADIGQRYVQLRTIQKRIAVARQNLRTQQETLSMLELQFEYGLGTELAVNQARYNAASTRASIPSLLATEEELSNALCILIGAMPGTLHAKLSPTKHEVPILQPRVLPNIPLDLLRCRPDVRQNERALAAQVARVGVATAELYPKFTILGGVGLQSMDVGTFLKRDSLYSSIGPSISWPIFRGGALRATIAIEESKMNEALLAYQQSIQTALGEIRNAHSNYTQQYHRQAALNEAVKAATDAARIAQDLYKNGMTDFNNVLDAERYLLQLQEAQVSSEGAVCEHLISLYKSLGGGI